MAATREDQKPYISGPEMQPGFLWKLIGLGVSLVLGLVVYRVVVGDFDRFISRSQSDVGPANYATFEVDPAKDSLAGRVDRESWALLNTSLDRGVITPEGTSRDQDVVLPLLGDSDSFVVLEAGRFSSGPVVDQVWRTDEVVRKLAHLLTNIATGEVSTRHFEFLNPAGELRVKPLGPNRYVLDPQNYSRYDFFVQAVKEVDPAAMVQMFVLLKPLLLEAYGELGYNESDFDSVVISALGELVRVPEVNAPIELVRPSVIFQYADPALEQLTSVQKQLIRMGPQNAAIVQAKLVQVAQLLAGTPG